MDQLKKRGFSLEWVSFLWADERSLGASFYPLPKIWALWTTLFSLLEGGWVCPYLVKELIMGWVCLPLKKKEVKLWRAAPLCLLWAIWIERNKVVFEDERFRLIG